MKLWHLTAHVPRIPDRVRGGDPVGIRAGSWPIEPGQRVWVDYWVESPSGRRTSSRADAAWDGNHGANSYWRVTVGRFAPGAHVFYEVRGSSPAGLARAGATHPPRFSFPEDADAQVSAAVEYHERIFGRGPLGMWPAEGAVAQFAVPYFARNGTGWIATVFRREWPLPSVAACRAAGRLRRA